MIDDVAWQLQMACNEPADNKTKDEETQTSKSNPNTKNSLEDDISILTQTYGELKEGRLIEIPLDDACELLNKTRHRVDTFAKLTKRLKENYNVTLKITSRKTK